MNRLNVKTNEQINKKFTTAQIENKEKRKNKEKQKNSILKLFFVNGFTLITGLFYSSGPEISLQIKKGLFCYVTYRLQKTYDIGVESTSYFLSAQHLRNKYPRKE